LAIFEMAKKWNLVKKIFLGIDLFDMAQSEMSSIRILKKILLHQFLKICENLGRF